MTSTEPPELGDVVQVFRQGHRGAWLALQVLVLAVAMSALAIGGLMLLLGSDGGHRVAVVAQALVGGGLVVFVVGAVAVPRLARARGAGLAFIVHQGGLVRQRDEARDAVGWDQILGVRVQLPHSEYHALGEDVYPWLGRILTPTGELECPIDLGPTLMRLIEDQARPHAWRRMIAAFEAGQPFGFGTVIASPVGLTIGAERLAWSQVQLVEEDRHELRIHTDLGGTVVDRFGVSFVTVLAELCEQMWTHAGNVVAIPRALPPAAAPVLDPAALPAARLVR